MNDRRKLLQTPVFGAALYLTVIGLFEARLSVADVTHGVMLQGTTPETQSDSGVAAVLLLMATTTTVPSAGF